MSGPVSPADVRPEPLDAGPAQETRAAAPVEVTPARDTTIGNTRVRRALPRRTRRTVGAWCFVDHFGPSDVNQPMEVAPHPHTGLQTVTWLLEGELLHRDSLGTEQLITPGGLNLMTSGHGIAHSEEAPPQHAGSVHGVQLWVALPEETRDGGSAFAHHGDLPEVELGTATATVLMGGLGDGTSPARTDTPLVGADLQLRSGTAVVPVRGDFEHAVVVVDGALEIGGEVVRPGSLAYLGTGRDELVLSATDQTRAVLVGGEPFPDPVFMWWNFVGRSRDEVAAAYREWEEGAERFGTVASPLARIPAPRPSWLRG